jgi:hypothetical protein
LDKEIIELDALVFQTRCLSARGFEDASAEFDALARDTGGKLACQADQCGLYRERYHIRTVDATRAINCKGSKRGKVVEVIVTN